jgi:hypothetical protein
VRHGAAVLWTTFRLFIYSVLNNKAIRPVPCFRRASKPWRTKRPLNATRRDVTAGRKEASSVATAAHPGRVPWPRPTWREEGRAPLHNSLPAPSPCGRRQRPTLKASANCQSRAHGEGEVDGSRRRPRPRPAACHRNSSGGRGAADLTYS